MEVIEGQVDHAHPTCLLGTLLPTNVRFCGYVGCHQCIFGLWARGQKHRQCPVHGPWRLQSAHNQLLRQLIYAVRAIDNGARILPEFCFKGQRMGWCKEEKRCRHKGRFVSSVTRYIVDVFVVLTNSRMIAFECDGRTHDRPLQECRDPLKQKHLQGYDVEVCRLDIRDTEYLELPWQQIFDRELIKARVCVRAGLTSATWPVNLYVGDDSCESDSNTELSDSDGDTELSDTDDDAESD